jgi:hypothetical protein
MIREVDVLGDGLECRLGRLGQGFDKSSGKSDWLQRVPVASSVVLALPASTRRTHLPGTLSA